MDQGKFREPVHCLETKTTENTTWHIGRVPCMTEYLEDCYSRVAWESLEISEITQQIRISVSSDQGPEIRRIC